MYMVFGFALGNELIIAVKTRAMETHLNSLRKMYGHQSLISLVNQKGYEKPVKEAYERYVAEVRTGVMMHKKRWH